MAVTLGELLTGAKELADMVGSSFISDATWIAWINQAIQELHNVVTAAYSDSFHRTFDFTLTSGDNGIYTLGSVTPSFMRLKGLDLNPGPNAVTVHKFNFAERNDQNGAFCSDRTYRVVSRRYLYIEPAAKAAGNYRLYYIPMPTKVDTSTDAIDPELEPFAEYIIVCAAIKALGKEESDTSELRDRRDMIRQDIEKSGQVDESEPDTVVDVESRHRWPWGR